MHFALFWVSFSNSCWPRTQCNPPVSALLTVVPQAPGILWTRPLPLRRTPLLSPLPSPWVEHVSRKHQENHQASCSRIKLKIGRLQGMSSSTELGLPCVPPSSQATFPMLDSLNRSARTDEKFNKILFCKHTQKRWKISGEEIL